MSIIKSLICALSFSTSLFALHAVPDLPKKGVMEPPNNSLIDPKVDYEHFVGRVTDKDGSGRILKIEVEINNTKFFKVGDSLFFKVNNHEDKKSCRANVRSVEDHFFTIFVTDYRRCWGRDEYFLRGMQLNFYAPILAQRVFEASKYREVLIARKEGHLGQLSQINHFLWTYQQQKMKLASKYDKEINRLRTLKQKALDDLVSKKENQIILQAELKKKLNYLDETLEHYRVVRGEYITDRWDKDHDSAVKFTQRPNGPIEP